MPLVRRRDKLIQGCTSSLPPAVKPTCGAAKGQSMPSGVTLVIWSETAKDLAASLTGTTTQDRV
jgi:hypothetical protein